MFCPFARVAKHGFCRGLKLAKPMLCPTFSIKLSKVLKVSSVAAVAIVVVLCWFLVGVFLGVCTRLLETRLVRSATVRNVFPAWFPAQESKRLLPEVLFAPLAAKNKKKLLGTQIKAEVMIIII